MGALSSSAAIRVCVTTRPRTSGEIALSVTRLISGNGAHGLTWRTVYRTAHTGTADQTGAFCETINGAYVAVSRARADLRVTLHQGKRPQVYEARFLLVRGRSQREQSGPGH